LVLKWVSPVDITHLGFVWIDGIRWNGVVCMEWHYVPLFGYLKKEWNRMELDGIRSTIFHHLLSFCFPSNLEGMGWNDILT